MKVPLRIKIGETTSFVLIDDKFSLGLGFTADISNIRIDFAYSYDFETKNNMSFTRRLRKILISLLQNYRWGLITFY